MYAELLPSAQRFISAVEENVNVELRTISGATGPLRPCLRSPRWIAMVASAQGCVDLLDLVFVRDFMRGRLQLYGAGRQSQFGCVRRGGEQKKQVFDGGEELVYIQ